MELWHVPCSRLGSVRSKTLKMEGSEEKSENPLSLTRITNIHIKESIFIFIIGTNY